MAFLLVTPVNAQDDQLQKMSNSELENTITQSQRSQSSTSAWKAAAQLARNKGYPLTATIIEHALSHQQYTEVNGLFTKSIKQTSAYTKMRTSTQGNIAFTKAMNADLYYALYLCHYHRLSSSQGMRYVIMDHFDFNNEKTKLSALFKRISANWSYLSTHSSGMSAIDIVITIDG